MSRYEYRVLKSTWGIAIDIEATYKILKTEPEIGQKISSRISLNLQVNDYVLLDEEKDWIIKGLKVVCEEIYSRINNSEYVLIIIHKIDYYPCDYQIDGLASAIIAWASQEFNFISPKIDIEFDKKANKYLFLNLSF
jgi:hypothetical protein